jgi:hypothetical protein
MNMERVNIGDRVFVASFLYKGWATVEYIESGMTYPVGVKLEVPDEDGHCYKRFAFSEVFTSNEG